MSKTVFNALSGNFDITEDMSPVTTRPTDLKLSTASKGGVFNGGFETVPPFTAATNTNARWIDGTAGGSTTNTEYGWGIVSLTASATAQFDTTVSRTGRASLRLDATDATGAIAVGNYANASTSIASERIYLKIKPSTTYRAYCYAKTSTAVTNSVYMDFRELNATTAATVATNSSNKLSGTSDWTILTTTFTTNVNTGYGVFILRLGTAGQTQTAWFDDITLEEVVTDTTFTGKTAEKVRPVLQAVTSTDNIDQSADTGAAYANTYTPATTITDTAPNTRTFVPTKQHGAKIAVYVVTKGTGDLNLRLHDSSHTAIFTATLYNSAQTNYKTFSTGWNYFDIPMNFTIGNTYHFHVYSTVADTTIKCNTAGDLSTCSFIQTYAKNCDSVGFVLNGTETRISSNDDFGFTPRTTFDLQNSVVRVPFPVLNTQAGTVDVLAEYSAMYTTAFDSTTGMWTQASQLSSNFTNNGRTGLTTTNAGLSLTRKINIGVPIKHLQITTSIYTDGSSRVEISPDGVTWSTLRAEQTDGSPAYVGVKHEIDTFNGATFFYLRYYKVGTSNAGFGVGANTNATGSDTEVIATVDYSSVPVGTVYPVNSIIQSSFSRRSVSGLQDLRLYFRLNKYADGNKIVRPALEFTSSGGTAFYGYHFLPFNNSQETNPAVSILSTTTNWQQSGTGSNEGTTGYILNDGEYMTLTAGTFETKVDYKIGYGTTTFSDPTKNSFFLSSNSSGLSAVYDPSLQQQITIGVRQQGILDRIKDIGEDVSNLYSKTNDKKAIVETKSNILSLNPVLGTMAYATDTNEFYIGNSSSWKKVPFALVTQSASPDIGAIQTSSIIGINPPSTTTAGDGSISDYTFSNGKIGGQGLAENGGIRFNATTGYMQIYSNSTWNNVVIGFTFQELAGYGYCLTHLPSGFTYPLEVMSGNSITNLGMNGLPITQGYITDMGAYPTYQSVGGRPI